MEHQKEAGVFVTVSELVEQLCDPQLSRVKGGPFFVTGLGIQHNMRFRLEWLPSTT